MKNNKLIALLPFLFLSAATETNRSPAPMFRSARSAHGSPIFIPKHTKLKGWQKELKRKK
jgi:hypothetical protein